MLTKRIIACLDVRGGRVVKGVRFKNHEDLGTPLEFAKRYGDEGADELVFYDITASAEGRGIDLKWISDLARVIDIPMCVAGGIRSVEDARRVLNAGADKVSVNSPALARPEIVDEIAREFGVQCVTVGIDSRNIDGDFWCYRNTGIESKTSRSDRKTLDWAKEMESRGAGEIVLNCMDFDGVGGGYDLDQLSRLRKVISIPLVASGGARTVRHFSEAFRIGGVDGALAAGAFHRRELLIPDLKSALKKEGISIR